MQLFSLFSLSVTNNINSRMKYLSQMIFDYPDCIFLAQGLEVLCCFEMPTGIQFGAVCT